MPARSRRTAPPTSSPIITATHGPDPLEMDCPVCAWYWTRHRWLPEWLDTRLQELSWDHHLRGTAHIVGKLRLASRLSR